MLLKYGCYSTECRSDMEMVRRFSIFTHIPKTAGLSAMQSLYGDCDGNVPAIGHTKIDDWEWLLTEKKFTQCFKFAFVRNPWSRFFSAYRFLARGGMNDYDRKWAKANIGDLSFEEFTLRKLQYDKSILDWVHFVPQHYFLLSYTRNKSPVDFIGFFENIKEDFDIIKAKVSPSARLLSINRTKGAEDYREHYTPEMIKVVAKHYAGDIELLGYTFDNSSLATQIDKRQRKQLLIQQTFPRI
ncbi:MAG: sulfotransferase family 2 domain-containing protein [Candidatus Oxydemutatoraceae bacterium WSBS_2016_MAG_OTU14]